ncbi:uncharacterized protein Triagg1_7557 [Trichoderma aggressivum f. europaeum]|uniref:Uncharacterized protein n=1 Tax=Trichoderma aggressivum f. europaeum TaxID=173218 RepID=A0AAE1M2M1_9HYPO|nr:hypothetical protein Triagg1_7557 [Trichoderma aggressivum f. europaeum]
MRASRPLARRAIIEPGRMNACTPSTMDTRIRGKIAARVPKMRFDVGAASVHGEVMAKTRPGSPERPLALAAGAIGQMRDRNGINSAVCFVYKGCD